MKSMQLYEAWRKKQDPTDNRKKLCNV
jgi:hypothetical protein